MVEAGQLRVWKKQADGGQFYNISDSALCFVTQRCETGVDELGRKCPSTFRVLLEGASPWFYETELEQHTTLVE